MKGKLLDNKSIIKDENNFEKEYEVISLIKTKDGNYLVYTDGKELRNGIALYVNSIIEDEDSVVLDFVTDDEMKRIISNLRERMDND